MTTTKTTTKLLQQAFDKAAHLPKDKQEALAHIIMAEIDWDMWDRQIEADSESGKLDFLVDEALEAHRAGLTKPLNLDEL